MTPLKLKQPAASGKTAEIKVEMHPEEEGSFNKTVNVYCNTKESPVKLTVRGTANKQRINKRVLINGRKGNNRQKRKRS
jgi:hypothetical protein